MKEKKHHAASFLSQMKGFEKKFMDYATSHCHKVHPSTLEVSICKYYLTIRVEGEDEDGNSIAFRAEIERTGDEIYQQKLSMGTIETEF